MCRDSDPCASRASVLPLHAARARVAASTHAKTAVWRSAAHRFQYAGPTGSGKGPRATRTPSSSISSGSCGKRAGRRAEGGSGAVEDVERRLVTRAEQLVRPRLVQTDRATGVRADLRERDEPFWAPVLASRCRTEKLRVDADEDGLPVGRSNGALGEDRHEPADGDRGGGHRDAGFVHEPLPATPGRPLERRARARTERSDREDGGRPDGSDRCDQGTDQEPASSDALAAVEILREGLTFLLARGQWRPLLGVLLGRQEAVRDRHQASPERAEGDQDERALQLDVPAACVDDRQSDRGGGAQQEGCRREPLPRPRFLRSGSRWRSRPRPDPAAHEEKHHRAPRFRRPPLRPAGRDATAARHRDREGCRDTACRQRANRAGRRRSPPGRTGACWWARCARLPQSASASRAVPSALSGQSAPRPHPTTRDMPHTAVGTARRPAPRCRRADGHPESRDHRRP